MEGKKSEEIAKILGEENEKSKEAGAEFELGELIDRSIDRRDETTADELQDFLKKHPELTYKAKETLEKSISNRREVDLLNYVAKVLEKLKSKSFSAKRVATNEIADARERAMLKGEITTLIENLKDEESLEDVKKRLPEILKKRPDLKDMFIEVVLDQLIKSMNGSDKKTLKSRLLDKVWNFLVGEDYR